LSTSIAKTGAKGYIKRVADASQPPLTPRAGALPYRPMLVTKITSTWSSFPARRIGSWFRSGF